MRFDGRVDLQLNVGFEPFEVGGGGNLHIFEILSFVEVNTSLYTQI